MEGSQITALLRDEDPEAFDQAVALVYDDLRRLARFQRRGSGGATPTLDTTALVHEAYLKLAGHEGKEWSGRRHFFAVASRAMRQILVDYARSQRRKKRGGGAHKVELEEHHLAFEREAEKLLQIDQALDRLAEAEPRQAKVVECRYFAGLTEEETAETVQVSVATVQRDWSRARKWLGAELGTAG